MGGQSELSMTSTESKPEAISEDIIYFSLDWKSLGFIIAEKISVGFLNPNLDFENHFRTSFAICPNFWNEAPSSGEGKVSGSTVISQNCFISYLVSLVCYFVPQV